MGLFGSKGERALIDQWRGRSSELPDAGPLSWKVVWEALAVDGSGAARGTMTSIGLRAVHVPVRGETASAHQGVRRGRPVHTRTGQLRGEGSVSAVWVGAVTPAFVARGEAGCLQTTGDVPTVTGVLAAIADAPGVWEHVAIQGGAEGLVVRRRIQRRNPQGWIHDLWLAERLADSCGGAVLPEPGEAYWVLPYGVASEPWS